MVGPIQPATESENKYIQTLVDYANRYPEAIPLPGIEAERVADALLNMVTRLDYVLPRVILICVFQYF